MTTETTSIERAMHIITEQRELINTYKAVLSSYEKRQESLNKYLETIYSLIEAGITNPQHIKETKLGMEHLSRLIAGNAKVKEPA